MTIRHHAPIRAAVATLALALAACGGGSDDDSDGGASPADSVAVTAPSTGAASPTSEPPTAESTAPTATADTTPAESAAPQTTAAETLDAGAPDLGRVVTLAEEFVLADVMSLGITPVASTATVDAAGFQGMDDFDTSGIEVLPQTTLSLEYLASLQPDTIITLQFWVDQVGADALQGMADLVIIPDGLTGTEQMEALGELLGRPEHAAAAIEDYEAAVVQAQERVGEGCAVSLATIYSGPTVAAFVAGPWELPSSILATGCVLDPSADDAEPDANGRAWLSLEQLGILDSETLILMQNETVEGETDAIAEVEASPLWASLPAVQADQVETFDRLGYPGLAGQVRFLDEFSMLMD